MPRRRLRVPLLVTALLAIGCSRTADDAAAMPLPPGDSILFIGNSLTLANDLPGIVSAFARAAGTRLPTTTIAYGVFALEDHFHEGTSLAAIRQGGWRVVVLQQGPSGQPESQVNLRFWTQAFDRQIHSVGARTALFSVWPPSSGPSNFEEVATSYSVAAADVAGIYLPVTQAWLEAWRRDPLLPLYSTDAFHPAPAGSYLAALTIYAVLTGRSPIGLPGRIQTDGGTVIDIAANMAQVLQEAAATAIAQAARP